MAQLAERSLLTPSFILNIVQIKKNKLGRGGGQVVSVLAFYSDDPSSNPADAYGFFCAFEFEKNDNKKRPGLAHFIKKGKRSREWHNKNNIYLLLPSMFMERKTEVQN